MKIDEALTRRFGSITLPCGACSRASPARPSSARLGSAPSSPPREGGKMEARQGEQQSEPGACDSDQLTRVKRLPWFIRRWKTIK